jgi:hypothetical protein
MEVSGQLHTLAALPLEKEPPHTHWIGHPALLIVILKYSAQESQWNETF